MKVPQDVKYIDIGKNEWPGRERENYSYRKIWEDGAVSCIKFYANGYLLKTSHNIDNNGKLRLILVGKSVRPSFYGSAEDIIPIDDRFEIRT